MEPSGLLNPPRLTPDEVSLQSVRRVRWNGLDPEEMQALVQRVKDELTLLLDERAELEAEVSRLHRERGVPEHGFAPATNEMQAVLILKRAQENAENLLADAQERARELAMDGHRRRDELIRDAQAKATGVIHDALEEATREAARLRMEAPIAAQTELARLTGVSQGLHALLTGHVESLQRMLRQFDEQTKAVSLPVSANI